MRKSDVLVIAAWAAAIFGLIEGIILVICRAYPANVAPYKVSNDALWIAPLLDLGIFLIVGTAVLLIIKIGSKWLHGARIPAIVFGIFIFLGIFAVVSVPKLIHHLSAVVLSFGLTTALCRKLSGSEIRLTALLRRRVLWIPGLIFTVGLGVVSYERAREYWQFRHLSSAPDEAVNVLLVVLDTVRYDRFTDASGVRLTPQLDDIAAKGVTFENAWSTTSWSLPSQASILTGRYPHEHGADWPNLQLDEKVATLGEFFGGLGYVTGAFSGNASWITPEYLGRGFLRFEAYIPEDVLRRTAYGRFIGRLLWEFGYHYAGRGKKAPELNDQLLRFLDDYPGRPFFAYLCYMDVNQAFHHRRLNRSFWTNAPPEAEVIAAYDRGLVLLDQQIGALFAELEKRRILKKTLVIITSDHGESCGSREIDDHDPAGHGTSLYPEQTRVPLFLVFPDKIEAARKVEASVSIRQIPKTITKLLGLADSAFNGYALPIVNYNSSEPYEAALLATLNYDDQKVQSVVRHPWHYIINRKDTENGEELYNLADDPLAKKLLRPNHSIGRQFRDLLEKLLAAES